MNVMDVIDNVSGAFLQEGGRVNSIKLGIKTNADLIKQMTPNIRYTCSVPNTGYQIAQIYTSYGCFDIKVDRSAPPESISVDGLTYEDILAIDGLKKTWNKLYSEEVQSF